MTLKLAVLGKKGGIGKTTTAVHFAALLAQSGERTILIDGDDGGFVTRWVKSAQLPFDCEGVGGLMTVGNYDAAVIDSQAGPSDAEIVTLGKHADLLILPAIPESQALEGVLQVLKILDEAGIPRSRSRALITMDDRTGSDTAEARAKLEGDGVQVLKATIRSTKAFRHASTFRTLVHRVGNRTGKMAWLDYEAALKEIRAQA